MAPDRYQIEIAKTGFVPDTEYNRRWSGRIVLNKATNTMEPDKTELAGSVLVGNGGCEVWDLSMWRNGRISGVVTSATGEPLSGITVQAFAFDDKRERESRPLRTGKTDAAGRYTIEPLPGGDYVVGVNAEKYRDQDPFPPTVFTRNRSSSLAARVGVVEGSETADVNLTLPDRRSGTTLRVVVMGPNGTPYKGAVVTLENLAGVQRWYSEQRTSDDGSMEVPAYVGERYVVQASAFDTVRRAERGYDYLAGSSRADAAKEHQTVLVVLAPKRLSDEH
jgi:5-hydroxyisourate hydrolase-like protein (transthyretin family)